jgi:hypothetical protein
LVQPRSILTARRKRRPAAALGAVLGLALCGQAAAPATAQPTAPEYAVKAAYLYKVAPFVEWPAGSLGAPGTPFNLCVQGPDPFGATLDQAVEGQRVEGHAIVVRRLETVNVESHCAILFAAGSRRQSVAEALRAVRGTPVLTATDGERAPNARGIVHFVLKDGRVRFDIDAQAAADNGLSISAKLLNLALSVRMRR